MVINPFHVTGLFLYPLKTLENQRAYAVFQEYRKTAATRNMSRTACEVYQMFIYIIS